MKNLCIIIAILTLSTVVEGALWVGAAQPIILSFGAVFAAINLDLQPIFDVDWRKLLIYKQEKEE